MGEIYSRKRHFKKTGKSKPEAEMKKTCLKEKGYSLTGVFIQESKRIYVWKGRLGCIWGHFAVLVPVRETDLKWKHAVNCENGDNFLFN